MKRRDAELQQLSDLAESVGYRIAETYGETVTIEAHADNRDRRVFNTRLAALLWLREHKIRRC